MSQEQIPIHRFHPGIGPEMESATVAGAGPSSPASGRPAAPGLETAELLATIRDPLFLLDSNWRVAFANDAAASLWGKTPPQLVGRVLWDELPALAGSDAGRALVSVMREQRPAHFEALPPGLGRRLEVTAFPGPHGMVLYFDDIEERKRVEEALRRSEAVLTQAGRMARLGAWHIDVLNPDDLDSNPLRWSDEVYRIFGYHPGGVEVTNRLFFEAVHPEDRDRVARAVAHAIEWHEPYSIEHRIVRPSGAVRQVLEHAEVYFDENGRPVRIVGAVQDVTETRRVEEELRRSRDTLQLAVEATDLGLFDYEPVTGKLHWNETIKRHFGLPPRAAVTFDTFLRGLHPDDRERVLEAMTRSLEPPSGGTFHLEYRALGIADGVERWLDARGRATFDEAGRAVRFTGTTVDISERKRVERQLLETSGRLALTVASAQLGTFDYRPLTAEVHLDEQARRMWGLDAGGGPVPYAELVGRIHPDDRARVERATTAALDPDGTGDLEAEYRIVRPDGSVFWTRAQGRVSFEDDGPVRHATRMTGVHLDITRRRRVEEERERILADHRRQREFLHAIMDVNPTMIFMRDRAGRYVFANPAFAELLGTTPEELIGRRPTEVGAAGPGDEMLRSDLEVFETGREVRIPEMVLLDAAGGRHVMQVVKRPILGPRGDVVNVLAAATDITEHKELESRLAQVQKSEAIGVLAGGVAHDFNNLLLVIMGNAELALNTVDPGSETRELLGRVLQAANHGAGLTRQLLAYVGKGRPQKEPLDITEVVREGMGLFESSIPSRIRVFADLSDDLRYVRADRTQIQQVLTNLALNAAEAIGERTGSISIRTSLRRLRHPRVAAFPAEELPPGRYVALEVTDDGIGMDDAVRARIFDPFFTTKFVGRGLGLAAVSGIVRSHHGGILLDSEPGRGTRFTILFPALAAGRRRSGPPVEPRPRRPERRFDPEPARAILIVDDQDVVREMTSMALQRRGYETRLAESGPAAIELFRREAGRIGLVILDLGMPGMGGEQVFEELLALDPDVKVIVSSGYAEEDALHVLHGLPVLGFLQKPYTPRTLAEVVARALGGTEAVPAGAAPDEEPLTRGAEPSPREAPGARPGPPA